MNLDIKGDETLRKFNLNSNLENQNVEAFSADGNIQIVNDKTLLDINLNFDKFNLGVLGNIGGDVITNIRGFATGNARIDGDFNNLDYKSFSGITIIISLVILMLVLNAFVFYLFFSLSRYVGKFLLALFFIINSISVYFINTYGVILDESMIGNVLNTKYEESSSFISIKLFIYLI